MTSVWTSWQVSLVVRDVTIISFSHPNDGFKVKIRLLLLCLQPSTDKLNKVSGIKLLIMVLESCMIVLLKLYNFSYSFMSQTTLRLFSLQFHVTHLLLTSLLCRLFPQPAISFPDPTPLFQLHQSGLILYLYNQLKCTLLRRTFFYYMVLHKYL